MKNLILLSILFLNCNLYCQFLYIKNKSGSEKTKSTFINEMDKDSEINLFQSNVFQLQPDEVNVYSEIVNGNIGSFNVSLGMHVNSAKETTVEDQTVQSLLSGGGNAILNAYYPIAYYKNSYLRTILTFFPKIGFQLPALGSQSEDATFNFQLGTEYYLEVFTSNENLKLYSNIRASAIVGSDDLYTNLEIKDKPFFLSIMNFGLIIEKKYRVSVSYPLAATHGSLLRRPVSVGTQIILDAK